MAERVVVLLEAVQVEQREQGAATAVEREVEADRGIRRAETASGRR
jgi:hypothetical protein